MSTPNYSQFLEPVGEVEDVAEVTTSAPIKAGYSQYLEEVPEEEGFWKGTERRAGQFLRRGLEGFAGVPGEIQGLGAESMKWLSENLREPVSEEEFTRRRESTKGALTPLPEEARLPTTENLREAGKEFLGEQFEPKGEIEEFIGQTAEDIGTFLFPIAGPAKVLRPALMGIGKNVAGQVGEWIAGDKGRAYLEIGALTLGSFIGRPKAKETVNRLYNEARELRNETAGIKASKLKKNLEGIKKDLMKGDPKAASKAEAFKKIDSISKKIKKGNIRIDELEAFKRDINESASKLKIFEEGASAAKHHKSSLKRVGGEIHKAIEDFGKKNPEYLKKYRAANQAASALYGGEAAAQFAERMVEKGGKSFSDMSKMLFAVKHPIIHGGVEIIKKPFGAGKRIYDSVMKSPDLRQRYLKILGSSVKENAALTNKYLRDFDKKLKNELGKD